jgi:flagellar protein FliS
MSYNANSSSEYLKNAVMTATPEQLQLMLYDGAIRFAVRGLEAIRAKDREAALLALERAQLIVLEMGNGIRREVNPELADRMGAIYSFVYRRLIDANVKQDEQALQDALRILRYERESWQLLVEKLQKETPGSATAGPTESSGSTDEPAPFNAEA